jgi:hypothetical protein
VRFDRLHGWTALQGGSDARALLRFLYHAADRLDSSSLSVDRKVQRGRVEKEDFLVKHLVDQYRVASGELESTTLTGMLRG